MSTQDDRHEQLARLRRLRRLGVKRGPHALATPPAAVSPAEDVSLPVTEPSTISAPTSHPQPEPSPFNLPPSPPSLPGMEVDTPFGPAWMRAVRYPLAERPDLAALLEIEAEVLAAAGRDESLAALDAARAVFIDTETTGLTPDTGTYTFLIGIGRYEPPSASDPGAFVVRQLFMRNPGEERALMHLVAEALGDCRGIVSFNGRGFDLPMVQNRFVLSRMAFPWMALPHFDLLPASRRVWRTRLESCRLASLEQNILGVQRSEDDVPGYLIPDIYRQYYRSGVVTDMLVRVFYHNLVDITTMPLLAARLAHLYQGHASPDRVAALHPAERLCLARAYADLGWSEAAELAYRTALAGASTDAERAQAYRELSLLLKRLERREEAAALWEEWVGGVPGEEISPYVELAKYHEWYTGDLAAAHGWAAWALRIVEGWPPSPARDVTLADLRHRAERLAAKISRGRAAGTPDAPD